MARVGGPVHAAEIQAASTTEHPISKFEARASYERSDIGTSKGWSHNGAAPLALRGAAAYKKILTLRTGGLVNPK